MDSHTQVLREEVLQFMRISEKEPEHVLQVVKLSLHLFEELHAHLDLDRNIADDQLLLESAAMLHDIGWTLRPDGRGHHKASEKMIREHAWRQLDARSVDLIANIARYHRKSPPKSTHSRFAALSDSDQRIVRKLAAVLRVADAMDRSHLQLIQEIRCRFTRGEMIVEAVADAELQVEQSVMERKSDLLGQLLGQPVRLVRVSRFQGGR